MIIDWKSRTEQAEQERDAARESADDWKVCAEREKSAREQAERKRDSLQRHFDAAAPEHNLQALLDLYHERQMQAERERDEARHAVLARFNEATEERAARELAEADNAALLAALGDISTTCEDKSLRGLDPTDANTMRKLVLVVDAAWGLARRAYTGVHPGAALLEYVRALEKVREALGMHPRVFAHELTYAGPELVRLRDACSAADALKVKP